MKTKQVADKRALGSSEAVDRKSAVLRLCHPAPPNLGSGSVRELHHVVAAKAAAATRGRIHDTDLGWLAGFLDGEGYIGAPQQTFKPTEERSRAPTHRLVVSISQNNLQVLEEFLALSGAHGKIFPTGRNETQNRQCYTLNYQGRHALEILYLVRSELRRKHWEADAAIELAISGKLGLYPGPKGFPEEIQKARIRLAKKLRSLK